MPVKDLPRDILSSLLFLFSYKEIVKICSISKSMYRLYNNEIFWRQYAGSICIKKYRDSDTYKQTVILNYLGIFELNSNEELLSKLVWRLSDTPDNMNYMIGDSCGFRFLAKKKYSKIVFRDTVKILIPFIVGGVIENKYEMIELELKPNTPVGSTLKYTLEEVYRKMYGLSDNDELVKAEHLIARVGTNLARISFNHIYLKDHAFEFFHKIDDNLYQVYYTSK